MIELSDIETKVQPFRDALSRPVEFPEPALRLNLASRQGNRPAQFKHLHQMCSLHALNFSQSNKVKVVVLLDGYIETCKAKNPLGPYLFARSLLELAAFLNDVSSRLVKICSKGETAWRASGEEFFGTIVRARFASSDETKVSLLKDLSKDHAKPINVMASLKLLAENPATSELASHYGTLCDHVHHNLSSQIASSRGVKVGTTSSYGNALFMTKNDSPITRYEYPLTYKGESSIRATLDIVDQATAICVTSLIALPITPYSDRQILKETGSPSGLVRLA